MKLSLPASSSDVEIAREIARRLHHQRRREDRQPSGSTPPPLAGAAVPPPSAAQREPLPFEPPAIPVFETPPTPTLPPPVEPVFEPPLESSEATASAAEAPPHAATPETGGGFDPAAELTLDSSPAFAETPIDAGAPTWDEPPSAAADEDVLDELAVPDGGAAAGGHAVVGSDELPDLDLEDAPAADTAVAEVAVAEPAVATMSHEPAENPSPGAEPDDAGADAAAEAPPEAPLAEAPPAPWTAAEPSSLAADAGPEEELFDTPPPPSWSDIADGCMSLTRAYAAMLVEPGGRVVAARGRWPDPGSDAIAGRLVAMMDRTLRDAPTRPVSAPVAGMHLTAWRVPTSAGLITAALLADAPIAAELRHAVDIEIHRGAAA